MGVRKQKIINGFENYVSKKIKCGRDQKQIDLKPTTFWENQDHKNVDILKLKTILKTSTFLNNTHLKKNLQVYISNLPPIYVLYIGKVSHELGRASQSMEPGVNDAKPFTGQVLYIQRQHTSKNFWHFQGGAQHSMPYLIKRLSQLKDLAGFQTFFSYVC